MTVTAHREYEDEREQRLNPPLHTTVVVRDDEGSDGAPPQVGPSGLAW